MAQPKLAMEPLISRSMNYLRVPEAAKRRWGRDWRKKPDPLAYIEETNDKVRIIYEWNKKELEK